VGEVFLMFLSKIKDDKSIWQTAGAGNGPRSQNIEVRGQQRVIG
jgi:hypothetical protein